MLTAVLCLALTAPAAEPELLLEELTTTGLDIPGGPRFKLPAPSMAMGMSKEKKLAVLEQFADEFPRGLFTERSLRAPYPLRIKSIPLGDDARDRRRGHTLDLWFVAYGKIEELDRQNVMSTLLGMNRKDGKEITYLRAKELAERGITPLKKAGVEERYMVQDMELIERVYLTGVMRSQKRWVDGSLVSAVVMDHRFANDREHPNRWRAIREGKSADLDLGPPHLYRGFGGYVKATPIPDTKDGIFIELHFAFHEPYEWFDGRNLMASKLPLAVRNNVEKVRRLAAGKPGRRK